MTLSCDKITEIFYLVDEFCLEFDKSVQKHLIGNKPRRKPVMSCSEVITIMVKALKGKIYADKGYISKELTNLLLLDGLHLITSIRNNMKNTLLELKDKILLRKRAVIETVNDELKNICQIEHSSHRSFANFITNLIAGLIAYSFFPKKPSIRYQTCHWFQPQSPAEPGRRHSG